MSKAMPRIPLVFFLLLATAGLWLLGGCSDSPGYVVEQLGENAQKRRLVQFRDSFSTAAQVQLKQQFGEDGLSEAEGWRDLMLGYLGQDRKPPEVLGEEVTGAESAVVKVSKVVRAPKGSKAPPQTIIQELPLTKQDDEWKLALGPMKYTVEKPKKGDEEEPEKPLAQEEEQFELDKKKPAEKVEDINLDDF